MSDINARMSVVEEKVNVANKRISDLEATTNDLPKLEVMMNMVIKTNEEQTQTLKEINLNLHNLNKGYENLDRRMGTVEANQKEIKTSASIDLVKLGKEIIFKIVPAIILTWLLIQFGL